MNNKSDPSSEVSNKFQQKSQEIMVVHALPCGRQKLNLLEAFFIRAYFLQSFSLTYLQFKVSRQNKGDFMLLFAPFYLQGEINVRANFNVIADRRFSPLWKVATAAGCETDADALWNIVSSNCGTQKNALNFN